MILATVHEATTSLSQLVATAENGETVILYRENEQVAVIFPRRRSLLAEPYFPDLSPRPSFQGILSTGFDRTETLSEEKWPESLR